MQLDLIRYDLEYDKAYAYLQYHLEGGATLSTELLNYLNFHTGQFFTLLPWNANVERIYKFQEGGITPSEEVEDSYEIIPTLQKELGSIFYNLLLDDRNLTCVFEDVLKSAKDKNLNLLKLNDVLHVYNDEVYLVVDSRTASMDVIFNCIQSSNAIWHFLCVLIKVKDEVKGDTLTLQNMIDFSSTPKMVVIGAYDSEGYVFWESKS